MGRPSRTSDQFIVRMPDGLRDQLKTEADKNNRSMNAEVVSRLEFSLQMHPHAYVIRALLDLQEKLLGDNKVTVSDETAAIVQEAADRFGLEPNAFVNMLLRAAITEMDNKTDLGKEFAAHLDALYESKEPDMRSED